MSDEINATEAAAEYAKENGVNLAEVKGTGADGRITKSDVQDYVNAAAKPELPVEPEREQEFSAPATNPVEVAKSLAEDVTAYMRDDPVALEIMALPSLQSVIAWTGDREKYQRVLQARAVELLGKA